MRLCPWPLLATLCGLVVGITATSASAQSLSLFERVRLDLFATASSATNSTYIGTNPAAVAWDGSQMYIGGVYNGAGTGTSAIIKVLNPTATPGLNITPTYSSAFNQRVTASTRGYSGLALSGTVLASAWFGSSSISSPISDGVKAFATTDNSLIWTGSLSAANIGGVAFDPGYTVSGSNQGGIGITSLYYGSGRRQLFDTTSGTLIYAPSLPTNGMIINTSPTSTEWRDVDFDPATGNIFSRALNNVAMGIRTGSNNISAGAQTFLVNSSGNGAGVAGQNLSFMGGVTDAAGGFSGDAVIWNDRPSNASSVYTSTMKVVSTGSSAVAINWNLLSGSTPANGNGWYDMDYDPTTKTVAIVDFQNRFVSIYDLDVNIRSVASGSETAAPIVGTKPLAKEGAGTLIVDQADPVAAGTIYVKEGGLQIGNGGTTGAAGAPLAITVSSGATLAFNRSDDYGGGFASAIGGAGGIEVKSGLLALANTNSFTGGAVVSGGTLSLGAGGSLGFMPSNITNNAAVLFNRANSTTYSGVISGSGSVGKLGAGTVTLAGANTYTGPTTVAAGVLVLGTNGSVANSPLVQVDSGATLDVTQNVSGYAVPAGQTLAGNGTVSGAVSIGIGATISPGASPGTLTVTGDAVFGGGGNYNWQILNAAGTAGATDGWDLVSVGGVLDVAATTGDPFRLNLWSLSSTGPDVSGNAVNFNAAQGYTWKIATAAGGITNFAAEKFQVITGAANGTGGFTNPLSGGTFSLALSGSTDLNLVYTAATPTVTTINVASGTQTQTAAGYPLLAGTTPVEKTGAGTVVFDQANTLTGPTTVTQGTLQLATADTLATSALTVAAGATVAVAPQVTAVIPSLTNNGLVDVGLGALTVMGGQTMEGLVAGIVAGRNDGTWDGATGITSSSAATITDRAVGWLDNGDGSFTVGFAAAGDLNLNNVVDFDDVLLFVSAGLYDTGLPATWAEGDYDYNGVVDFDDVLASVSAGLFDTGPYNPAPSEMSLHMPLQGFGGGGVGPITAVPEPATCMLAAVGAALAAGCRWRSRRRTSR